LPHAQLRWYNQWLWGKVAYAIESKITHFADDDSKVEALFLRYAPEANFSRFSTEGGSKFLRASEHTVPMPPCAA
jgi:hypothetical protein